MKRLVVGWVALAVVLTGATQLRLEGLPVGPGEGLLAAWLLLMAVLLLGGRVVSDSVAGFLLMYWLIAAALLGMGSLMAVTADKLGGKEAAISVHHVVAFLLVAMLSYFVALRWRDQDSSYHLSIARVTFFALTLCTTTLLALAMVTGGLGPVHFWYGYRFCGWAENPNQMALSTVAMPFLGAYLMAGTRGWRRGAYGVAIACNVAVGLATVSDGLRVALLGTAGVLAVLAWGQPIHLRRHSVVPYVAYVIVPFLVVFGVVAFGSELLGEFEKIAMGVYEEGGQGDTRVTAWLNGLRAISESPVVGWGPGSFSGLRGPFENFEAHNWLIDWGMSTGLLGILLHVALLSLAGWRALRAGALALSGVVVALALFSVFANTLRQPIYWLLIVLVLALTEHPLRVPHRVRVVAPAR